MDDLIARAAPLEMLNNYGGTPLASTVYAALNTHDASDAALRTVQQLLDAGANAAAVGTDPTEHAALDALLARYR